MKYTLTPSQRAMAIHQTIHTSDNSFDPAFLWKLSGAIDSARLDAVIDWVLSEMTAFRTSYSTASGDLEAEVHEERPHIEHLAFPAHLTETEIEEQLQKLLHDDIANGPFSLAAHCQARCIVGESATTAYVILHTAHIAGDVYACYEMLDAMSSCYDSPQSQWPHITARLREHPGSLPLTPPSISTLEALAHLYAHIDSFTNTDLVAPQVGACIPGRRDAFYVPHDVVDNLRRSDTYAEFGPVVTLYTAYAAMVQRICSSDDLIIGVPIADRAGANGKRASGFFVNTLPLPLHIDRVTTWRDVLTATRRGLNALQRARSVYPLTTHRVAVCPQVTSHALDNAVTYYKRDLKPHFAEVHSISIPVPRSTVPYSIMASFTDGPDAITVELSIADAYEQADLPAELITALSRITQDPTAAVIQPDYEPSSAAPLDEARRGTETIWQRIQSVARARPTDTAIRADRSLTYAELVDRSRRVADGLRRAGATHHVILGLPKSADFVVAFLGIMASGGVCVPFDPSAPSARLQQVIAALAEGGSGSMSVIVEGIRLDHVRDIEGCDALLINALGEGSEASSPAEFPADDTAYVIFTSGSTGHPKGVEIGHSGLLPLFDGATQTMGLTASDSWIWLHSSSFDYSVWEIFCPLTRGAVLCIPDEHTRGNPVALAEYLAAQRVTVLCQTPAGLKRFDRLVAERPRVFSTVRILTVGGEAFSGRDLTQWRTQIARGMKTFNVYGLTESTIIAAILPMTGGHPDSTTSLIGFPIQSFDAVCLDRYGRIARPGQSGELHLAGAGLARGYVGLPEESRLRFRHLKQPGGVVRRWLATGDRCRPTRFGLAYIGRVDRQVQLRGFRIELGDLESTAIRCEGVRTAAAAKIDSPDGPFLAVWYSGEAPTGSVLDHLRRMLPAYMVPAAVERRAELPITVHGKTDFASLTADLRNRRAAPRPASSEVGSHLERVICEIWSAVTGTLNVLPTSRLFDIGGTSLDAVEITRRINDLTHPTVINVVDLFEYTTPAELAWFIEAKADEVR